MANKKKKAKKARYQKLILYQLYSGFQHISNGPSRGLLKSLLAKVPLRSNWKRTQKESRTKVIIKECKQQKEVDISKKVIVLKINGAEEITS